MKFFKKNGRPSDEEYAMLQVVSKLIQQKEVSQNEIPECHSLEDLIELKSMLESYQNDALSVAEIEQSVTDSEQQAQEHEEEGVEEIGEIQDDLHTEDTDTEYPDFPVQEQEEGEQENMESAALEQFITDDYDPFSSPILERSYTSSTENQPSDEEHSTPDELLPLEESKEGTPLDDLNPRIKRRAAEQTADTILKGYAKLAPKPFKWLAKFPEAKIEKMVFSGQIDPDIEVSDGLSFDEYVKQTNDQIDEIFEVEKDTLDEIREPLVEVLMEQKLELTPQQRLGMAVFSHLMQMLTVALKLRSQNNRILSYQKHLTSLSSQRRAG